MSTAARYIGLHNIFQAGELGNVFITLPVAKASCPSLGEVVVYLVTNRPFICEISGSNTDPTLCGESW